MNGEGKPSITLRLDQTCGSGFAAVRWGYEDACVQGRAE